MKMNFNIQHSIEIKSKIVKRKSNLFKSENTLHNNTKKHKIKNFIIVYISQIKNYHIVIKS